MKLPKIKFENMTPELQEIANGMDLEFDAIVDPMDVFLLDETANEDYINVGIDLSAEILNKLNSEINSIKDNINTNETQGYHQDSKENPEGCEETS